MCVCGSSVVISHPEHDAMFNVEQNLFLLPVVSDEGMQGITVGYPANQAGVGGQGDHGVALNTDDPKAEQEYAQIHTNIHSFLSGCVTYIHFRL